MMRNQIIVIALLALAACAARVDETPRACTMEYNPVCGEDGRTYGNPCQADAAGVEYERGECRGESAYTECAGERPEACTKEYLPVCAAADTGIRCVAAPCDEATEWRTYGNACKACADSDVYGYRPGECEA